MKIDPRSDRIALHYTGNDAGEPAISGVPARDLTENDVDRLVRVEHGDGLHGAAYQAAVDKQLDSLTDGPYRRTAPPAQAARKPARKSTTSTVPRETSAPSTPAAPAPQTTTPPSSTPPAEPSVDSTEGDRP